jgi:hypothetical protein
MKQINKNTLDNLIKFEENRDPAILNINESEMSFADLMSVVQDLLVWHKKTFMGLAVKEFMDLSDLKEVRERLKILFALIPDLETIFTIKPEKVIWSEQLSTEHQDEIRNYIHENFKIVMKIRRDRNLL